MNFIDSSHTFVPYIYVLDLNQEAYPIELIKFSSIDPHVGQSPAMSSTISRMQFLRGGLGGRRQPLRPPWSPAEALFVDRCDRCGDCVTACPDAILVKGRGGFPEMDFSRSGCSFCGDCLAACKGKALAGNAEDSESAWSLKAEFGNECLSVNGVVCRSCGEVCDEDAIRFRLEVGGVARPLLDADRCSGCGGCHAVCPVRAVRMSADTPLQEAV